jgi:hypothetical protein
MKQSRGKESRGKQSREQREQRARLVFNALKAE